MKLPSENRTATFSVLEAADWVNVFALTEHDEVVLAEQFRFGISAPTLEIPGGIVDKGESPAEAASRELLEETGYAGDALESLGVVSANPALFTNTTHLFLSRNCRKTTGQKLDGNERIKVHTIPIADFLEMVKNGQIHHPFTVAATARFLLFNGERKVIV